MTDHINTECRQSEAFGVVLIDGNLLALVEQVVSSVNDERSQCSRLRHHCDVQIDLLCAA